MGGPSERKGGVKSSQGPLQSKKCISGSLLFLILLFVGAHLIDLTQLAVSLNLIEGGIHICDPSSTIFKGLHDYMPTKLVQFIQR